MNKRIITLMDMRSINGNPENSFKVVKLQNTASYKIGEFISETMVVSLCKSDHTTVNIIAFKK